MEKLNEECRVWDTNIKHAWESPPEDSPTGNPRKVIWKTIRIKCSKWHDQLRIKEEEELEAEGEENKILKEPINDSEELEDKDDEELMTLGEIRESFARFLPELKLNG